jgi:hypothetical protein
MSAAVWLWGSPGSHERTADSIMTTKWTYPDDPKALTPSKCQISSGCAKGDDER